MLPLGTAVGLVIGSVLTLLLTGELFEAASSALLATTIAGLACGAVLDASRPSDDPIARCVVGGLVMIVGFGVGGLAAMEVFPFDVALPAGLAEGETLGSLGGRFLILAGAYGPVQTLLTSVVKQR